MRILLRVLPPAVLVVAAVFGVGCEDSPLSAGKDYTMTLVAQPTTVPYDETGPATISALVLNADGAPQSDISVYFSNTGGTLSPSSGAVKTNSAGVATATLTLVQNDATDVDVSATSAALTETVTIARSGAPANQVPTAIVDANPPGQQEQNGTVEFFGDGSFDPDEGDYLTHYKWEIRSTNSDSGKTNPILLQGDGLTAISIPTTGITAYTNVQHLTVTLTVTDSHGATGTTILAYEIVAGTQ